MDVEQEDKLLGLLQMGLLPDRVKTAIGCDENKPFKSSLRTENIKISKSDGGFFILSQIGFFNAFLA